MEFLNGVLAWVCVCVTMKKGCQTCVCVHVCACVCVCERERESVRVHVCPLVCMRVLVLISTYVFSGLAIVQVPIFGGRTNFRRV